MRALPFRPKNPNAPFSRSVIRWCREVSVDSTLFRCSVSFLLTGLVSSNVLTRDRTCFSISSILFCSRSFRLLACAVLFPRLYCCIGQRETHTGVRGLHGDTLCGVKPADTYDTYIHTCPNRVSVCVCARSAAHYPGSYPALVLLYMMLLSVKKKMN